MTAALLTNAMTLTAFAEGMMVEKVFGKASARPKTAVPAGASFSTEARSLSQLSLAHGAVLRTGANSEVQNSSKGLVMRQGVALVAEAPGMMRHTTEVRLPGYKMKVRGTVQVAYDPGHSMKVVALEGTVTVALDSLFGEFQTLQPGQLLVLNPSDSKLPEPVEIDLQKLVATSTLVKGPLGELPTAGQIGQASAGQGRAFRRGDLASTPLLMQGLDNSLLLERRQLLPEKASARVLSQIEVEQNAFRGIDDLNNPRVITGRRVYQYPTGLDTADTVAGMTFKRDKSNVGQTHVLVAKLVPHAPPILGSVADGPPRIQGLVDADADFFAGRGRELKFLTFTETPDAFDRLQIEASAVVLTPTGVALAFETPFGVTVDGATLLAGTGTRADERLDFHAENEGITIKNGSVLKGGSIALKTGGNFGPVQIDSSTLKAQTHLTIGDAATSTGITISNSTELAAIAGNLSLLANRADFQIETSKTLSAKGKVTIDANASNVPREKDSTPGVVSIRNTQIMANAIRIRGFSDRGEALILDGGTFTAPQFIKLYADGVSTLRFKADMTLNTKLATLAGKTVLVDNGKSVKVTGQAQIFTDDPRFNMPNYGAIAPEKGFRPQGKFGKQPALGR